MFDIAQIRRAHEQFATKHALMVQRATEEAGKFAVDYVQAHPTFKPRTGNLQRSTGFKVVRTPGGRVLKIFNSAKYAASIDSGAKAHVISARYWVPHTNRGRGAKLLRFVGRDGRLVFTRHVNHPGIRRPYKFLYRASNAAGRILEQQLRIGTERLAREF